MSYRPSFLRSGVAAVIALPLLALGLSMLAPAQDTSSGGVVTVARAASVTDVAYATYELPPSQPHEFTLTSDGQ